MGTTANNWNIGGALAAAGATALAGALAVSGNAAVGGTLGVTDTVTLSDHVSVTRQATCKALMVGNAQASALTKQGAYNFTYFDGTNRPRFTSFQMYDVTTNVLRSLYLVNGVLKVSVSG